MGRIMEQRFKLEKDTEWWFVSDNTIKVNEFGYRDDLTGEDKYRGLQQDLTEQETVDLLNGLYEENEQLKQSNKDAWNLIQFIYNEIKEDGYMDWGRIQDLVEF